MALTQCREIKIRIEKDRPALLNGGHFHLQEVGRAFTSPHVMMLTLISFFNGTTIYGLAVFMPTIVNTLGFSPIRSQLLAVGPFGAAFVGADFHASVLIVYVNAEPLVAVTLLASWASDRYKSRTITIACSSILGAVGYIIYLCKLYLAVLYVFFTFYRR